MATEQASPSEGATRRVYLVLCSSWSYNDEFYVGDNAPVKAFTSRAQAEAYIRTWEEYFKTHIGRQELMFSQGDVSHTIVEADVDV
jgi:hypothetical protein